ncbi:hypothetical protein [Methylobacterium goesingense]|uniref:Plasmid stability protein n=1 Tax=Methylobacterium goesingense TaxID=243690 RepID=A0ABV2LCJ7_9HYPH|nr:hypothetical protein [Methylobacterium goesingense]GJD76425.1 hypothetical protein CFIICLFH_4683 [Methylobacterium goesingense]
MANEPTSPSMDKAMVYLPRDMRRAMKVRAAEQGRTISDLYAEAIGGYLKSRADASEAIAPEVRSTPVPPASAAGAMPEDIAKRILDRVNGYGRMIAEIHTQTSGLASSAETRAVAIVIAALCKAVPQGINTAAIKTLLKSAGFKQHEVDYACDTLLRAGVARHQGGRWHALDVIPGVI